MPDRRLPGCPRLQRRNAINRINSLITETVPEPVLDRRRQPARFQRWLVSRPVPCHLEVAELTPQVAGERAERAALGDRVPSPALADTPPEAASARGDLSYLASSEQAQAAHSPHRRKRVIGLKAFNRLIEHTHVKLRDYPEHVGRVAVPADRPWKSGPSAHACAQSRANAESKPRACPRPYPVRLLPRRPGTAAVKRPGRRARAVPI